MAASVSLAAENDWLAKRISGIGGWLGEILK